MTELEFYKLLYTTFLKDKLSVLDMKTIVELADDDYGVHLSFNLPYAEFGKNVELIATIEEMDEDSELVVRTINL